MAFEKAPGRGGGAMFIRKELERRGNFSLVKIQVVGVNGQIESTNFEITGPRPGQFSDLATARTWLDVAAVTSEFIQIEAS